MQLLIANKNYSSWSMRPWVLMRQFGIGFDEVMVRFGDMAPGSPFKRRVEQASPAGRVPVLLDEGFAVWDTLAITEYLAEKFPQLAIWPRELRARARARSLCAEMHAGFSALRQHCPMNLEARLPEAGARALAQHAGLRADLERIVDMWQQALADSGGPFLFGEFSAVDAYYAPVAARTRTYELPLPAPARAYAERILATPAVQAWVREALNEHDFVTVDEPYRTAPGSNPT